ncbi:MAG: hypothetical protein ACLR23_04605 [Clostridia bacterium]
MSWIDKLYETYENCQEYVGKDREDMLLPIAHTTNNAQIQVTLNQDAEIVMAEKVPKGKCGDHHSLYGRLSESRSWNISPCVI